MSRHNIVGSEAILTRGWAARERAFSPAHGSILILPRRLRARPLLIFAAGFLVAIAAGVAAVLATSR